MIKRHIITRLSVIAGLTLMFGCGSALSADLSHASTHARAVALSDARVAPTSMVYVIPGGQYDTMYGASQCARGGFWSEFSAYRWNGSALGGQRWNAMHDRAYWRDPSGGRVTFDGRTIYNGTRHPILFGGWCS